MICHLHSVYHKPTTSGLLRAAKYSDSTPNESPLDRCANDNLLALATCIVQQKELDIYEGTRAWVCCTSLGQWEESSWQTLFSHRSSENLDPMVWCNVVGSTSGLVLVHITNHTSTRRAGCDIPHVSGYKLRRRRSRVVNGQETGER